MTPQIFSRRLQALQPKETITYHIGYLMKDRDGRKDVADVADAAWRAAGMVWNTKLPEHGQWKNRYYQINTRICTLVQRKLGALGYEYIAVRR